MKRIAMCWKCANSVMQRVTDEVPGRKGFNMTHMELVGCKENPDIKGYEDTQEMCPVLKELADKECKK